jgi:hypothetical protein
MGKKHKNKNKNRKKNNLNNNQNDSQNQNQSQNENQNQNHTQPKVEQQSKYESFDDLVDNNVYDAEKIEQLGSTKKNIITLVVVVFLSLLLTLLILLTTGLLKGENIGILNFANNYFASEKITTEIISDSFVDSINDVKGNESYGENMSRELAMFSTVELPMLMGDYYDLGLELEDAGCDKLYWITRNITPTAAPLNATYSELFSYDVELDFFVGNYAAQQSDLDFDYAEIENGTAKVYLNGTAEISIGECDSERLRIQITAAAMQFNTVKSVEIYLNGELY